MMLWIGDESARRQGARQGVGWALPSLERRDSASSGWKGDHETPQTRDAQLASLGDNAQDGMGRDGDEDGG